MHEIPQTQDGRLSARKVQTKQPNGTPPTPGCHTPVSERGKAEQNFSLIVLIAVYFLSSKVWTHELPNTSQHFDKYSTWTSFLCFVPDAPFDAGARLKFLPDMWVKRQRSVKTFAQPSDERNRISFSSKCFWRFPKRLSSQLSQIIFVDS